jgi:hypothetical protein
LPTVGALVRDRRQQRLESHRWREKALAWSPRGRHHHFSPEYLHGSRHRV